VLRYYTVHQQFLSLLLWPAPLGFVPAASLSDIAASAATVASDATSPPVRIEPAASPTIRGVGSASHSLISRYPAGSSATLCGVATCGTAAGGVATCELWPWVAGSRNLDGQLSRQYTVARAVHMYRVFDPVPRKSSGGGLGGLLLSSSCGVRMVNSQIRLKCARFLSHSSASVRIARMLVLFR
jgi:hypothetical protein